MGQICTNCTVTDFRISDTLAEPVPRRPSVLKDALPVQATLTQETTQSKIAIPGVKCKIGRDPTNQIVIKDDQYASRFHAWITYEDGHFFIEDLGSTNGTLLNGSPLINRRPLVNGDQLRIGRSEFKFQFDGSGSSGRSSRSNESVH